MNPGNQVTFPDLHLSFHLDSIAFEVFGLTVTWYGLLITVGIVLALCYAYFNAKRFELDFDKIIDAVIAGLFGGIVCARLYYVIFNFSLFRDDWLSIFRVWEGGIAIYGGMIGALLAGGLVCKWRKLNIASAFDLTVIGFSIGQAIGRWGNFFNQEAFGSNTDMPWRMVLSENTFLRYLDSEIAANVDFYKGVHPCFLYESIWCAIGFFLLHRMSKHRKFNGQLFVFYIGWYGLGRLFIEGLRADSLMLGPIRVSQLISGLSVLASATILWVKLRRANMEQEKQYLPLFSQGNAENAQLQGENVPSLSEDVNNVQHSDGKDE